MTHRATLDNTQHSTTKVVLPGSYPDVLKKQKDTLMNQSITKDTGCLPGSYPGLIQQPHQISSQPPNTKHTPKIIIKYQKPPKIDEYSSRMAQKSNQGMVLVILFY